LDFSQSSLLGIAIVILDLAVAFGFLVAIANVGVPIGNPVCVGGCLHLRGQDDRFGFSDQAAYWDALPCLLLPRFA